VDVAECHEQVGWPPTSRPDTIVHVAIQSASEFEAVVTQVINRVDKELGALGSNDALEKARRDLAHIQAAARDGAKLKAARNKLDTLTDGLSNVLQDDHILNQMWDLLDYIDYRT
jgi:hypothetical protein